MEHNRWYTYAIWFFIGLFTSNVLASPKEDIKVIKSWECDENQVLFFWFMQQTMHTRVIRFLYSIWHYKGPFDWISSLLCQFCKHRIKTKMEEKKSFIRWKVSKYIFFSLIILYSISKFIDLILVKLIIYRIWKKSWLIHI